jgi:hypothetical protein
MATSVRVNALIFLTRGLSLTRTDVLARKTNNHLTILTERHCLLEIPEDLHRVTQIGREPQEATAQEIAAAVTRTPRKTCRAMGMKTSLLCQHMKRMNRNDDHIEDPHWKHNDLNDQPEWIALDLSSLPHIERVDIVNPQ